MYRIMPKSKDTLTTTIVGEWIIADDKRLDVDSEMRLFQCAVRTAFNRLLEGMSKGDVEKLVSIMFNINSRYAKDSVMQAESIISSQKELVKQYKKDKERAIKGLRKKLGKFDTATPACLPPLRGTKQSGSGRQAEENLKCEDKQEFISANKRGSATGLSIGDWRLMIENNHQSAGLSLSKPSIINHQSDALSTIEQLQEELSVLEGHIACGTIPKVIFGGRENFEKRRDGKLSKEDWKNLRNNKLYSRGDKSKEGGNLNTRIEIVDEGFDDFDRLNPAPQKATQLKGFSLSVAISHKVSEKKTAPRVTGRLWVDVRKKERLREHLEDGSIYSIEIIRGLDKKYRVHITFDEFVPVEVVSFLNGAIGVDVNPDGIALTETDSEGNFISSSWRSLPELTYSSKNRRDNLIGETAAEIVSIALSKGKGLVIESLHFVKKKKGKQFNRMSHNFVYRRLLEAIERQATKCGVTIKQVNPAYTSIIGKYKYATAYGLSFHQAAAFVIARRGLGFRERIPKKIQRLIENLISKLNSLLPAMEAKGRRQVKGLLNKLENWRNIHSWSFWHTFNQSLRKVGVKPWLLEDFNGFLSA